MSLTSQLHALAGTMRANSERWFPGWHADDAPIPLPVAYTLGMVGEAGEVANAVKKLYRDGETAAGLHDLALELADVFTYLILLADEVDVDLIAAYRAKTQIIEMRKADMRPSGSRP